MVYKFHTNFIQISYKFHTNFIQISYKFHTNFIQISYKFHTNFIQISYKFHTNSYKFYKVRQAPKTCHFTITKCFCNFIIIKSLTPLLLPLFFSSEFLFCLPLQGSHPYTILELSKACCSIV
jgi:hypothetical protein